MHVKCCCTDALAGQIHHMLMMREKDHLDPIGQRRQNIQGGPRPFVVEAQENIVHHEGQRLAGVKILFDTGQSQGEIELVGGAVA